MQEIDGLLKNYDKNVCCALTHSSFGTDNYERLEFLGDCILNYVVGEHLFKNESFDEGKLTKARANLVSKAHLANVCDNLNLTSHIRVGNSLKTITDNIKCDVVESIVASYYLKYGLEKTKLFVIKILDEKNVNLLDIDYKTKLQEILQKQGKPFDYIYELEDNAFNCSLFISKEMICKCKGKSKSESAQNCAKFALENL